jgi:hypothetical protein
MIKYKMCSLPSGGLRVGEEPGLLAAPVDVVVEIRDKFVFPPQPQELLTTWTRIQLVLFRRLLDRVKPGMGMGVV